MPAKLNSSATNPPFIQEVRHDSDVTTIAVSGELDLAYAEQLDRAIRGAERGQPRSIVIDLNGLRFLDSTGLSILLKARRRSAENGDRIRFVRPEHGQVTRLLALTQANDLLFD